MIKLEIYDPLVVLWIIMHRLSVAGWSHQRILLFNALLTCYTAHIVCRHFYTVLCRVFLLSFIYCKYIIVTTGTPPLTRFFGPGKNRVKGKPFYRRSILVLKPKNGEYESSKSTFFCKFLNYS